MYPSTLVLSNQTGFYNGDYGTYPYGSYKTSNNYLLFPVEPLNTRLEAKERVYAVIEGSRALVFRFDSFKDGPGVYNDKLLNEPIVVAGNKSENYMVAYKSTLEDGTSLSFKAVPRNGNIIMEDNAGNQWSIFGEAISGPRSGEKLSPCHAYMSYWFAVGAFFKDAKIFGEKLPEPN